uniref:C-type lectin domain-containing protein n=1 Tax=Terrapene triunguis TaxID=2587831 RepID=A0A674J0G9_9SAUR
DEEPCQSRFKIEMVFGMEKCKHSSQCPSAASRCPDGWIGIQGKFYYFSNVPGNWTYSQSFCSSHGASLAGIESPQQLSPRGSLALCRAGPAQSATS